MSSRKADSAVTPAAATAERSFDELFLEHWNMVYGLLRRMLGDPAEAEDLALETFWKLYRNPPRAREDTNLKGWLYRVATRLGLHSIRRDQRRQRYELAAGREALELPSQDRPAELLDSREAHRMARQALSQIRPGQAQLLTLRYSGLSYKEIAEAMGLSPSSIGPLLLRAERAFAKSYRSLSREEE